MSITVIKQLVGETPGIIELSRHIFFTQKSAGYVKFGSFLSGLETICLALQNNGNKTKEGTKQRGNKEVKYKVNVYFLKEMKD